MRSVQSLIRAVMELVMVGRRKGSRRGTWQKGKGGGREIEVGDEERVWIGEQRESVGGDRFLIGLDGGKVLEEFWAGVGKWDWCCGIS